VQYRHQKQQSAVSLQHIIRLLALNLFAKRDLIKLIKAEPPPDNLIAIQLALW
jgi:hypothetical protein